MSRSIDELLGEIEKTDDRATYVVLADALVEGGDPRGELALDAGPPDDDELLETATRLRTGGTPHWNGKTRYRYVVT